MKFNGTVYRHKDPEDYDMDSEAERVTRRYTVPSSEKWKPIFKKVESMLCFNGKSAWENLSVQFHQNKIGYLEGRGQGRERGVCQTKWQGFDILETIPKVAKVGVYFRFMEDYFYITFLFGFIVQYRYSRLEIRVCWGRISSL